MAGRVYQINVSPGGVPKRAVAQARVGFTGVEGDRQAHPDIHGGPLQAVCLYSREVIEALRAEGHPVEAGSAGENLTLEGLDWSRIGPGSRLRVGAALVEVTRPTNPCHQIAASFVDGRFDRIRHDRHPGWSRMYARVLSEGLVRRGDEAAILEGDS